jgi:AhpD family alkylhydroperoxidase
MQKLMAQIFNKRIYGIGEFYHFFDDAMASFSIIRKARKNNLVSKAFQKRIMLVVTEVNGCQLCSYWHTKEALRSGMPAEEIKNMLSGSIENVTKEESVALFFAQHYAESAANPDKKAWQRVMDIYGEEKAQAILAFTKVIMMGNVYGIAVSALLNRIIGKPVKKSRFLDELGIVFGVIFFIPILFFKRNIKS